MGKFAFWQQQGQLHLGLLSNSDEIHMFAILHFSCEKFSLANLDLLPIPLFRGGLQVLYHFIIVLSIVK